MSLFGGTKPRTVWDEPQMPAPMTTQQVPTMPIAPVQAKPGHNWAGIAADFMAGLGGQAGPFAAMQQRKQEMDFRRQQSAAEDSQWYAHQRYEAANPKPSEDAFTRALDAAGIKPGSPEYAQMARKRAEMLTNPVQLVPDGMGGYQAARPNEMGAVPSAPVGPLRPYGGPASQSPGGFR